MSNIIPVEQYEYLRHKIDAYENARNRLYPGVCAFTPCMIENIVREAKLQSPPTNEERSKVEQYEWVSNPPLSYFAYINEKKAVCATWMGDKLGNVGFGSPFHSNLGDVRVPITVYGINGKVYHGTYYKSAGDYCRIKMSRKKVKK